MCAGVCVSVCVSVCVCVSSRVEFHATLYFRARDTRPFNKFTASSSAALTALTAVTSMLAMQPPGTVNGGIPGVHTVRGGSNGTPSFKALCSTV